ncbi:MAG: diaminopimelate epimerase [Deltaproteobacteria bacterium]|nr:diaminopimelate epimerase [Deltaproteobacteria bacterium]
MKEINFLKLSGSGNDFIIIDNRKNIIEENNLPEFIKKVCRRKISVGADGLILIEDTDTADFKWRFYNSDGSIAEMCGNGARCAARFAFLNNIAGKTMVFETIAGRVTAIVKQDTVKIGMPDPFDVRIGYPLALSDGPLKLSSINTGVPHVVIIRESIDDIDILKTGKEIRFHKEYAPAGTNVNFAVRLDMGLVGIRTYERGVEDETLACGTGSIAAALVMAGVQGMESPLKVKTKSGGILVIHFEKTADKFTDIFLEGDARVIYKGELMEDAWKSSGAIRSDEN